METTLNNQKKQNLQFKKMKINNPFEFINNDNDNSFVCNSRTRNQVRNFSVEKYFQTKTTKNNRTQSVDYTNKTFTDKHSVSKNPKRLQDFLQTNFFKVDDTKATKSPNVKTSLITYMKNIKQFDTGSNTRQNKSVASKKNISYDLPNALNDVYTNYNKFNKSYNPSKYGSLNSSDIGFKKFAQPNNISVMGKSEDEITETSRVKLNVSIFVILI